MIIGIAGKARTGKTTLANGFKKQLEGLGINSRVYAFADQLKGDLDEFTMAKLGISAFTEDNEDKKVIRPLLQCWGTNIWRFKDPDHWVKKLAAQFKKDAGEVDIALISDVRFPNEINWLKTLGGKIIYLIRKDDDGNEFPPAGIDEETNDPLLRKEADFIFSWGNHNNNLEKCYYTAANWLDDILATK
jgi:hypothetical protein